MSEVRNPSKEQHTDALYQALTTMCPGATHAQILEVIKALEAYVNFRVMEHLAL